MFFIIKSLLQIGGYFALTCKSTEIHTQEHQSYRCSSYHATWHRPPLPCSYISIVAMVVDGNGAERVARIRFRLPSLLQRRRRHHQLLVLLLRWLNCCCGGSCSVSAFQCIRRSPGVVAHSIIH